MNYANSPTKPALTLTRRRALQLAGAAALLPSAAFAQAAYPNAPITVIIPTPPGGVLDVLARGAGEFFKRDLGQQFIVENAAGASGMLGAGRVARAKPDGYTVLLGVNAPFVTGPFTMKDMPFDPDKDFAPVVMTTQSTLALVAHSTAPVKTLQEFIAYAKANPEKLAFASAGIGTPHHFAGEYLAVLADIKLRHVAYKGSPDATADVTAGHVPTGFVALGGILEQEKAGIVKILAITDDKRNPLAPDVPTIGEIVKGYVNAPAPWNGMFMPAATPKDIVAKFNKQMNVALSDPEFSAKLKALFLTPGGGTPEELTQRIKAEREVARTVASKIGLVPS